MWLDCCIDPCSNEFYSQVTSLANWKELDPLVSYFAHPSIIAKLIHPDSHQNTNTYTAYFRRFLGFSALEYLHMKVTIRSSHTKTSVNHAQTSNTRICCINLKAELCDHRHNKYPHVIICKMATCSTSVNLGIRGRDAKCTHLHT